MILFRFQFIKETEKNWITIFGNFKNIKKLFYILKFLNVIRSTFLSKLWLYIAFKYDFYVVAYIYRYYIECNLFSALKTLVSWLVLGLCSQVELFKQHYSKQRRVYRPPPTSFLRISDSSKAWYGGMCGLSPPPLVWVSIIYGAWGFSGPNDCWASL